MARLSLPYPLVEVRWVDILGDSEWKDAEQVDELIREAAGDLAVTFGLLVKETDSEAAVSR